MVLNAVFALERGLPKGPPNSGSGNVDPESLRRPRSFFFRSVVFEVLFCQRGEVKFPPPGPG